MDRAPLSPEARRWGRGIADADRLHTTRAVVRRVFSGVIHDGTIHAGNLAYLSLLTLFPFIIALAAIARLFGQKQDIAKTVTDLLSALPHQIAHILTRPIHDVLHARTGHLLLLGGLLSLWTVASYVETLRDILQRAYGVTSSTPFWHQRLRGLILSFTAIILLMTGFATQVVIAAVEEFVFHLFPLAKSALHWLQITRLLPSALVFLALYLIFWTLTPQRYRTRGTPKWPGALFVMLWWFGVMQMLPVVLDLLNGDTLTYGGLAGVIITLIFFWFIGYGLVIGAHLNAALAEPRAVSLKTDAGGAEMEEECLG
ncbi:MAG: YihY/virulence factor BrkB family protein [Alphaproteobacteria bacterium]|nr:YihY/virulence factor BrkB family protein [Alphaproteobacteria bacterium]MDE2339836.1 YihY/virulence factor BrkB family protein [Alphaproteobacteria bacterium]